MADDSKRPGPPSGPAPVDQPARPTGAWARPPAVVQQQQTAPPPPRPQGGAPSGPVQPPPPQQQPPAPGTAPPEQPGQGQQPPQMPPGMGQPVYPFAARPPGMMMMPPQGFPPGMPMMPGGPMPPYPMPYGMPMMVGARGPMPPYPPQQMPQGGFPMPPGGGYPPQPGMPGPPGSGSGAGPQPGMPYPAPPPPMGPGGRPMHPYMYQQPMHYPPPIARGPPPLMAMLPDYLPGAASLYEQLDKQILVILRDGRNLVGTLRSFDQFSNMVMQDTVERRTVNGLYGDIPIGLYIVRGDSVVLLGEVDPEREAAAEGLTKVSAEEILEAQQTAGGASASKTEWEIE